MTRKQSSVNLLVIILVIYNLKTMLEAIKIILVRLVLEVIHHIVRQSLELVTINCR